MDNFGKSGYFWLFLALFDSFWVLQYRHHLVAEYWSAWLQKCAKCNLTLMSNYESNFWLCRDVTTGATGHLNFQIPSPYPNQGGQILPTIAEVAANIFLWLHPSYEFRFYYMKFAFIVTGSIFLESYWVSDNVRKLVGGERNRYCLLQTSKCLFKKLFAKVI